MVYCQLEYEVRLTKTKRKEREREREREREENLYAERVKVYRVTIITYLRISIHLSAIAM
jgi:hypothetical protein